MFTLELFLGGGGGDFVYWGVGGHLGGEGGVLFLFCFFVFAVFVLFYFVIQIRRTEKVYSCIFKPNPGPVLAKFLL